MREIKSSTVRIKSKTLKGWAAVYSDGHIYHEGMLPCLYFQRTKPRVFREGQDLTLVRFELSYTLQPAAEEIIEEAKEKPPK